MTDENSESSSAPVFALAGAFSFLTLVKTYKRYLHEHVRPNFIDRVISEKEKRRHFETLLDVSSIMPLAIIWNYSSHLQSPQMQQRLFRRKNSERTVMTQQMLGEALQDADLFGMTFNSSQMYVQRARRLVEAATLFGLVEVQKQARANLKPLIGTQKLHTLMMEVLPGAIPFERGAPIEEQKCIDYIERVESRVA